MSRHLHAAALICVLSSGAATAQTAALRSFAPPENYALEALSSGAAFGVTTNSTTKTNVLYAASSATPFTVFSGNSSANGFSGNLGISANGGTISGASTVFVNYGAGPVERSQAARYDVATQTWTTLGSLGFYSTGAPFTGATVRQESAAYGISADGSVVVGESFWRNASTPGSSATSRRATVFRNGSVIDLTAGSTTTSSGRAVAVSGNGDVVAGYTSNNVISTVWRWNGSAYVVDSTPTITANVWRVSAAVPVPTLTQVTSAIAVTSLSENGRYGAGPSVNGLASVYSGYQVTPTITYSPATFWDTQTNTGKLIPYSHVIDTTGGPDTLRNMKAVVAGVSNNGLVIGSFPINVGGSAGILEVDTWIYDDSTGVTKTFDSYLNETLGGNSFGSGAGQKHVWSLTSMAADGSAISGLYYDKATLLTSGFVLNMAAAVPEPSTYLLLGLGLAVIAWRRKLAIARLS